MTSRMYGFGVLILTGGLAACLGFRGESTGGEKPGLPAPRALPTARPPAMADATEAGIRATTVAYVKAFNAADAPAAAALWTAEGEYIAVDGTVTKGREAIEKSLAEHFKAHPKVRVEIHIENVRILGRGIASVEATVQLKRPGEDLASESRYSAVHVLEDGKWHAASVREWAVDPATDVSLKALEWLVGEWTAKGEGGEVKITYAWDEARAFLHARYTVAGRDGQPVTSGTQVIGRNPGGGLQSWLFDGSGTTSHAVWVRDGTRWLSEAAGVLPDGTAITSLSVVVRVSPDSFTWQTTDRAVNGEPLPALPPVKVTRVHK